jgi:hypothetical protein
MYCTVRIRPIIANGLAGTSVSGEVRTSNDFSLYVVKEAILFDQTGPCDYAYRYRFSNAGTQIMRIQTDKNGFPANARFPNKPDLHFQEQHWDAAFQRPDFLKMYTLFRQIVSANGELPEPFRTAAT